MTLQTRSYWPLTIAGYGLLFSIHLLAFAGYWQVAAFLIILERMGKAIRTPARDTILSHATKKVGRGWGFGVHEALDQVGAIIGPVVFSLIFLFKGGYRLWFFYSMDTCCTNISYSYSSKNKSSLTSKVLSF